MTGSSLSIALDYAGFTQALEGILSWLRTAKDSLSNQHPIARSVEALKSQFHQHEVAIVKEAFLNSIENINNQKVILL